MTKCLFHLDHDQLGGVQMTVDGSTLRKGACNHHLPIKHQAPHPAPRTITDRECTGYFRQSERASPQCAHDFRGGVGLALWRSLWVHTLRVTCAQTLLFFIILPTRTALTPPFVFRTGTHHTWRVLLGFRVPTSEGPLLADTIGGAMQQPQAISPVALYSQTERVVGNLAT